MNTLHDLFGVGIKFVFDTNTGLYGRILRVDSKGRFVLNSTVHGDERIICNEKSEMKEWISLKEAVKTRGNIRWMQTNIKKKHV